MHPCDVAAWHLASANHRLPLQGPHHGCGNHGWQGPVAVDYGVDGGYGVDGDYFFWARTAELLKISNNSKSSQWFFLEVILVASI